MGEDRVQFASLNWGFFIINLQSQEDKTKILEAEKWIVAQQNLTLMEWYPSFEHKQRSSRATVWVKFSGLPIEFWIEKTLLSMGKTLGTPIVVDQRTLAHEYGHFASILIDIDFAELDTDGIHVSCSIIGHSDSECRKKNKNSAKVNDSSRQLVLVPNLNAQTNPEVGKEWHEAKRKKKGKKSPTIPVVLETSTVVGIGQSSVANPVVSISDVVEMEQQLQDEFAESETALRLASAIFEKKIKPY
ncbi:uncharacterized protein LOC113272821 [Papaver somniferum]|uniref:uncharacterized protein LOC113272821 n=1 Tax=Papaver somniferum TaxID=3469 RepID=UPI000E705446|nr:uncharacterized protein LOC113272821 [Papaver somniferum]